MTQIIDSGNRTEFATGAVRDIQQGKGRFDLMPLDVMSEVFGVELADELDERLRLRNGRRPCRRICVELHVRRMDDGASA